MYEIISYAVKLVFTYCTDFVINLSNLMGLSYYEINTIIFIILWPLLTVFLGVLLIVQKVRISRLKRRKATTNIQEYLHYQKN